MKKTVPLSRIIWMHQLKGMSATAIAEHFGVSRQTISERLMKAGIRMRPSSRRAKFPDKKLIEELYIGEMLSLQKTAERLDESLDRIVRAMDFYGIPRRRYTSPETSFSELKGLGIGESVELPRRNRLRSASRYYSIAKAAGIRVSVSTVNADTVRLTRIE